MPRESKTLTITPATPVRATPAGMEKPALCLTITVLPGAACEYVNVYCTGQLVTVLAPSTSTAPGVGRFEIDRSNQGQAAKLDISEWTVDGAHADSVLFSWENCR